MIEGTKLQSPADGPDGLPASACSGSNWFSTDALRNRQFESWLNRQTICPYEGDEKRKQVAAFAKEAWEASEQRFLNMSTMELAAESFHLNEYLRGVEEELSMLERNYNLMRAALVDKGARELYGGRQAAACYTPMEDCIKECSDKLGFQCRDCGGTGGYVDGDPSGEINCCQQCEGAGMIYIPKLD